MLKTIIATGETVEIGTCIQDTNYLCCEIDLDNSGIDPCNKVTSCANPKDGDTRTCTPNTLNGDYMCQVNYYIFHFY